MAIILISSDLLEVVAMSDRVLVMREGRQMGIVDRAEATQEAILALAMGQATGGATGASGEGAGPGDRSASVSA
jgi:rhamnose transport system ATP-binding protein